MNYSFSDPSCGLNRYNNWVPQGCFPGSSELNRRLSRTADCRVQSNVWCEPEPRQGVGILGVFAALAGIAIVATAFRQPSHHVTVTKQVKKPQEVASKPTDTKPTDTQPADTKPDAPKPADKKDTKPNNTTSTKTTDPKPTLTKPAATASREDKHEWLTANNIDHKYGHLNYSKQELLPEDAVKITLSDGCEAELHKLAAYAFKRMQADAKKAGINLQLNSAYRSQVAQQQEWDNKVAENKKNWLSTEPEEISKTVAPAGYSEHGTGYAVDFDLSPEGQYDKATDDWIQANASRYGFVNSFTEGNAQGVNAEPWHWRFEGNDLVKNVFKDAHDLEALK